MFTSQLTGWDTNDNKYSTATSLSGPWSSWQNFASSGSKTHNSQTTFVLDLGGMFMYMGDRWVPSNLMSSTYVWLPLNLDSGRRTASLPWFYNWIPQVSNGRSPGPATVPSDNSYEAESGSFNNEARVVSCSECSNGKSVGYLGGSKDGTLTINNVHSDVTGRTTIRARYLNGDKKSRYAIVTVNGRSQTVAFVPTKDGKTTGVVSFTAELNAGSGNTVSFRGINGGWGRFIMALNGNFQVILKHCIVPDIDRILVPVN